MTRRLVLPLATALALTGCGNGASSDATAEQPTPAAPATSEKPPLTPEEFASLQAGSNIPPVPNAKNRAAYLAALERINPELIEDRNPDALVDRGRDQCTDLKERPKSDWLWWVNQRFTSPEHPNGFDDDTPAKVLAAIRKYICPSY